MKLDFEECVMTPPPILPRPSLPRHVSLPISIPEHQPINKRYHTTSPSQTSPLTSQSYFHIFRNINNTLSSNMTPITPLRPPGVYTQYTPSNIPSITPTDFPSISSYIKKQNSLSISPKRPHFVSPPPIVNTTLNTIKSIASRLTTKATANFRPIRPVLSVESYSFSPLSDDNETSTNGLSLHSFDDDNANQPKLNRVLSTGSMNTITEFTSINTATPTRDYATFRLNTALAMTPFAINKSSFLLLHEKHLYRKKQSMIKEGEEYEMSETIFKNSRTDIPKMSVSQTIFTIVNVYVNNTMLFNSYALKKGGLCCVILFAVICIWLCYSGKLMINLFAKVPQSYRSFTGIALYCWGYFACFMIGICIVLENMGRSIICLMTMWDNIRYLIKFDIWNYPLDKEEDLKIDIAMISSILLLLPAVWMIYFSDLIFDSILGFISTSLLSIIVIINFILKVAMNDDDNDNQIDINYFPQDMYGLVLCIGIFISNLAGHACLPTIYSQMKDQEKYPFVLNCSWIIIFIIQMVTGIAGYCTYGNSTTKTLITLSIIETSSSSDLSIYLSTILVVGVIINLFVHVPIGVAIASELPENTLLITHPVIRRVFRTILFVVIVYTAWLLSGNVAFLSAIMGSILTITISMLYPLLMKREIYLYNKAHNNIIVFIIVVLFASFSSFTLYVLFHFNTNG